MFSKKLLVLAAFAAALSTNAVFAYKMKIKNETSGTVEVMIAYGGAGICSADRVSVKANSTRTVDSVLCCFESVEMIGRSGSISGNRAYYTPRLTGFGIGCRDQAFKIKQNPDNSIIAEHM